MEKREIIEMRKKQIKDMEAYIYKLKVEVDSLEAELKNEEEKETTPEDIEKVVTVKSTKQKSETNDLFIKSDIGYSIGTYMKYKKEQEKQTSKAGMIKVLNSIKKEHDRVLSRRAA